MESSRSENNTIRVSVKNTTNVTKVNASSINSSNPVKASNNQAKMYEQQALAHANTSKYWAEQSETSAINSANSATQARNSVDAILLNEDFIAVNNSLSDINLVSDNINSINYVAKNQEKIEQIVEDLNNLGDTTNINIVSSNISDVNTNAENIISINKVANSISNVDSIANNLTEVLNSNTYANEAKTSANNAYKGAEYSALSEANAKDSENKAKQSEQNAKTSETNASTSSKNAKIWAEGTDAEVQALGGIHSAKEWAKQGIGVDKLLSSKAYESNGRVLADEQGFMDVQKYNHSTFDLSKFTVVGNPTITNDGVASGFTGSQNHIYKFVDIPAGSRIKFIFKLDSYSASTLNSRALFSFVSNSTCLLELRLYKEGNKASFVGATGETTREVLAEGLNIKLYTVIEYYNGTADIYFGDSLENLVLDKTVEGIFDLPVTKINYGVSYANALQAEDVAISLKDTVTYVNNGLLFNGNKTGVDVIKSDDYTVVGSPTITSDGVASGFGVGNNYIKPNNVISIGGSSWKISGRAYAVENIKDDRYQPIFTDVKGEYRQLNIAVNRYGTSFVLEIRGEDNTAIINTGASDKKFLPNSWHDFEVVYKNKTIYFYTDSILSFQIQVDLDNRIFNNRQTIGTSLYQGSQVYYGSIDLNSFKIYVDGQLVCQPCLKIPYNVSKTGSKIVPAYARDRVQDVYEQYGQAEYYTIDEENKNFTLPMGEIYGMIAQAKTSGGSSRFIGEIISVNASESYVPDRTLPCDGAEYSKSQFPILWNNYLTGGVPTTYEEDWQRAVSYTRGSWNGLAYGVGKYVLVGQSGTVTTSEDGSTWTTPSTPAGTADKTDVAFGNNIFVACSANSNYFLRSTDGGNSWANANCGNNEHWTSIAYGNGVFVVVSLTGHSVVSADGSYQTWSKYTISSTILNWQKVVFGNAVFVAMSSDGYVAKSVDGASWTISSQIATKLKAIAFDDVKNIFIVVAEDNSILSSTDGNSFVKIGTAPINVISRYNFAVGGGKAVVHNSNEAYETSDYKNWTLSSVPTPYALGRLAYANDKFFCYGSTADKMCSKVCYSEIKPLLNTCTYAEYETDITNYGECGKFAVDETNGKFRVPLISDKDTIATNKIDYANGIEVSFPTQSATFIAPCDGEYITTITGSNTNAYLNINGVQTAIYHEDEGDTTSVHNYIAPLSKGDVIYWTNTLTAKTSIFYPYIEDKKPYKTFVIVERG